MPKLSDLLAEKAKAELQVGGATVNIVFYVMPRERFTEEEWTALLALRGRDYLKAMLPHTLISWDIVDDSGTQIPVTPEAFDHNQVPDVFLFPIKPRIFASTLPPKI